MSFTYTLPPASNADRVRFLVGDITEDGHHLEDEEIALCLAETGDDPYFAGAMCCEFLAAKYSARGRKSVGSLSIDYSQMAGDYSSRASALRELAYNRPGQSAAPYTGGISKSDKKARQEDEDWEHTQVSIDFTNVRGSVYSTEYPWNSF